MYIQNRQSRNAANRPTRHPGTLRERLAHPNAATEERESTSPVIENDME